MAFRQTIERLDQGRHETKDFDCGKASMDRFLKQFAARRHDCGINKLKKDPK